METAEYHVIDTGIDPGFCCYLPVSRYKKEKDKLATRYKYKSGRENEFYVFFRRPLPTLGYRTESGSRQAAPAFMNKAYMY